MFVSTSRNASRKGRRDEAIIDKPFIRFSRSKGFNDGVLDFNHKTLIIISPELVRDAGFTREDYVDLELDEENALARLIRVFGVGWKVSNIAKSGSATIRYTNNPDTLRIKTGKSHEFIESIISVKEGEIIFELDSRFNRDRNPLKFFRTYQQQEA